MKFQLSGVGVALVTPFNEDGTLDIDGLQNLVDHVSSAVDYLVVMGTTGESATTSQEEKSLVLQQVISSNKKGLPVVIGIGGNNTATILKAIDITNFNNIAAILSVSPYYNKPSQEGLIAHYKAIADACPVPVILYNVPGRTSSNITAETTLQLARHSNIIGIKEASGSVTQCLQIATQKPDDFQLISGDDMFTVSLLSMGGIGVISVLANAFPQIFKNTITAANNGDYSKASKELGKLLKINPLIYRESNPVGIKEVLRQLGICKNFVRLPLVPASQSLKKEIQTLLKEIR